MFRRQVKSTQLMFAWQTRSFSIISPSSFLKSDPYYILGVSREDKLPEVKKAYFKQAKKYHPDLNPGDEHANQMFLQV